LEGWGDWSLFQKELKISFEVEYVAKPTERETEREREREREREMEEVRSTMEEHMNIMLDMLQKASIELRSGFAPAYDNFMGFFHAIDWKVTLSLFNLCFLHLNPRKNGFWIQSSVNIFDLVVTCSWNSMISHLIPS